MKFRVRAYESKALGSASAAVLLQDFQIEAASLAAATILAQNQGFTVVSVRGVDAPWRRSATRPFDKASVLLFCQELLALLQAGMGLVESIDILQHKAKDGVIRQVLTDVMAHLREGKPLSKAFELARASVEANEDAEADRGEADGGPVFPTLLIATVRSAERTGQITEALKRYLDYQTELNAVRDKVIAASIYPALLLGMGFLVIVFLMTYVVPRFSAIYADVGQDQLPMLSRWLMQWGILINAHLPVLLGLFITLVAGCIYLFRLARFQAWLVQRLWNIPRVGEYLHTYQLAQFVRTLSMLLTGGIPLVRALDMTSDLLAQPALSKGLIAARQAISEGQSVSDAFQAHGLATPVGVRLLVSGERSGDLAQVMGRIAG